MSAMESQINGVSIVCCRVSSFRRPSKKTWKLHVTGRYEVNPSMTDELRSQRASNADYISIWWHHHHELKWWTIHLVLAVLSVICSSSFILNHHFRVVLFPVWHWAVYFTFCFHFHFQFLRARYPEYGSTQFIVEGWETIEFAVHLDCECRCRVQVSMHGDSLRPKTDHCFGFFPNYCCYMRENQGLITDFPNRHNAERWCFLCRYS